jgi:hypothetical protein
MILPPTFSMKSPKATKTSGPEDTNAEMLTKTNTIRREEKETTMLIHW